MKVTQQILTIVVRLYRWVISPAKTFLFGPLGGCRFTPSCSEYALEALHRHGSVKGSWLTCKRLLRCHPWGGCGHDPVPSNSDYPGTTSFADRKVVLQTNLSPDLSKSS